MVVKRSSDVDVHVGRRVRERHMRTILFIAIVVAVAVLVGWEAYDRGWL